LTKKTFEVLDFYIKVMNFGTTSNKSVPPRSPDKGSFPLDHDAECKELMSKYKLCLKENQNLTSKCRLETKNYLSCRMEKDLMMKEDLKKLGFSEDSSKESKVIQEIFEKTEPADRRKQGFVAGVGLRDLK